MININSSTMIEQPVGEVFDFVRNQENAQTWLSGWLESRPTSETEGVGFTWVDVLEVFGRRVETEFELTAFEPDKMFAFKSIRGSFPIRGVYAFEPAEGGTAVTFELRQQRLPDDLAAALEEAVQSWEAGESDATQLALEKALILAREQGYL